MKKHLHSSEATAKYNRLRSQRSRKIQAVMETDVIALPGSFSKFFALKEDAWESALVAVIPGKFIGSSQKAFYLDKNS